jgi:menaquinone-specific isochorismate synthase
MDIVTTGTPKTHEAIGQQPIDIYRDTLLTTLQAAAHSATRRQRRILASFTFPITAYDSVRTFQGARQAELGECFFWEHPVEHQALVGVGAALTIETRGNSCFTDAASMWREVMQDAIIGSTSPSQDGPIFFGGFAFDPLSARTRLWADFPDGLLLLPSLLISYKDSDVTLTVNRMIGVADDIEQCADEMIAGAKRLHNAIERGQPIALVDIIDTYEQAMQSTPTILDMRPASEWMALVADTMQGIQQGKYEKVVLARGVQVLLSGFTATFDIAATLQQLCQQYPDTYVFAIQRGERFFVGATPERLVQARDRQIRTMALAGSAPRGASEEEDMQIGLELLQNRKNNAEHALVVAEVRDALLAHCTHVHTIEKPQLLKLKNVQHLKTPIVGELLQGRCILDVMAQLHPTPAVGGFPREAALTAIRDTEQLDRGWYAGPLGWIGASGHGEFAVALRSGLVDGNSATLFAGCGIVAASDPQSEYDESCLKLQVMLRGLQVHSHDDM